MITNTARPIYGLLVIFSLLLLAISFILQFGYHLAPCPLCMIDRIIVCVIAILFAVAYWHHPKKIGQRIYSFFGFALTLIGIAVTSRLLWIAHLPKTEVPVCTPGFNYLFDTLSPKEAILTIFKSSGECTENMGFWLGLSLPAWTLIAFLVLAIGTLFSFLCKNEKNK